MVSREWSDGYVNLLGPAVRPGHWTTIRHPALGQCVYRGTFSGILVSQPLIPGDLFGFEYVLERFVTIRSVLELLFLGGLSSRNY